MSKNVRTLGVILNSKKGPVLKVNRIELTKVVQKESGVKILIRK